MSNSLANYLPFSVTGNLVFGSGQLPIWDGDLDRVTVPIKLGGFIGSTIDFSEQARGINSSSTPMFEIFENKGKHARSAVRYPSLPLASSVEIDGVFEFN